MILYVLEDSPKAMVAGGRKRWGLPTSPSSTATSLYSGGCMYYTGIGVGYLKVVAIYSVACTLRDSRRGKVELKTLKTIEKDVLRCERE